MRYVQTAKRKHYITQKPKRDIDVQHADPYLTLTKTFQKKENINQKDYQAYAKTVENRLDHIIRSIAKNFVVMNVKNNIFTKVVNKAEITGEIDGV